MTTKELWKQRIKEIQSSGSTIEGYCRKNGLKASGYYYWRNRIEKPASKNADTYIPVRLKASDIFSFSIDENFKFCFEINFKYKSKDRKDVEC